MIAWAMPPGVAVGGGVKLLVGVRVVVGVLVRVWVYCAVGVAVGGAGVGSARVTVTESIEASPWAS